MPHAIELAFISGFMASHKLGFNPTTDNPRKQAAIMAAEYIKRTDAK